MSSIEAEFQQLTEGDQDLFNTYEDPIRNRIYEVFPSMLADFHLKPLSIRRQLGCGTFYTYKVLMGEKEVIEVSFYLGGKRATPLVGPPHFEITKNN